MQASLELFQNNTSNAPKEHKKYLSKLTSMHFGHDKNVQLNKFDFDIKGLLSQILCR